MSYLFSANGGQPRISASFVLPEINEDIMLGCLFGLTDEEHSLSLRTVYDEAKEDIPAGFIPIGEDPGGNRLLLATSGNDTDAIYFWDRLGFLVKRTGKKMFFIANNIDDFLGSLQPIPDD
jgi:hypothetical protein